MGLNFSSTYDQCVKFISENDIEGLKKLINSLDGEEVRQHCLNSCPEDELNRSLLHHAVWRDDVIILQTLMPYCEGDSLEIYDAYGMTPLSAAINCANYEAVKLLLEHSSQINCDQLGGYMLIRSASYTNCTEIVNILLQYNCETQHDETDLDRGSILHVATDLGNLDIVKLMVEKGKLSMNIGDRWKITPVHVAAAKNRIEILRYFVENNVDHDIEDIFGNTPLGWAVFCKADECIEYLKSLNAKEKEFVVPPPPPASNDASEELTDIPLGTKPVDGKLNPSFELNETKTETTIV